jgi:hypothetical protein
MTENINKHLYHVIKDGKSGFINDKGQIIIDFEFDGASSFSEGFARIFVNDKVGFINTKGDIVIPPTFDSAMGFSNGLAVVTIGDHQGYINYAGETVIKPRFYRADDFENETAKVMPDIMSGGSFINKDGDIILDGYNFSTSKYHDGLINCGDVKENWGFINLDGHFVIPPTYKFVQEFSEGKAAVAPQKDFKGKPNRKTLYGFINKQNEMIIPPIFQGADIHFSNCLCAVWDKAYGYIDDTGQLVIPYEFELGEHFKEGLAVIKPKGKNKKYGYIDKSGQVIIKPIFSSAESFENDLASVIIGEEYDHYKYGYINKKGDYIWEPTR